jgi:hypothetical protein
MVRDGGGMAGKIGEEDRERMEAALVEALEWLWRSCAAQSSSRWGDRDGGTMLDGGAARCRMGCGAAWD